MSAEPQYLVNTRTLTYMVHAEKPEERSNTDQLLFRRRMTAAEIGEYAQRHQVKFCRWCFPAGAALLQGEVIGPGSAGSARPYDLEPDNAG